MDYPQSETVHKCKDFNCYDLHFYILRQDIGCARLKFRCASVLTFINCATLELMLKIANNM
jgi:hypothetical protein